MFELKDHLQHPGIWGRFFEDALQGSYMAWAHCTDHHACERDHMLKLLKFRLVPTVFSQRGADLINPYVQMIKHALDQTQHLAGAGVMEKFIVISDSTLPVKPFALVHWDQTASPDSDICISSPNQWATYSIDGEKFALVKHHQWMALNRSDAEVLANHWPECPIPRGWNATLRNGKHAGMVVPRRKWKGGTWYSATDEEAVYERLFGPLRLPEDTSEPLTSMARPMELFRHRRCSTYVDWPANVADKSVLAPHMSASLLQVLQKTEAAIFYDFTHEVTTKMVLDPSLKLSIGQGIWHPFTIEKIGNLGLSVFRNSQYLFARKFSDCAHMPNYTEIMFAE